MDLSVHYRNSPDFCKKSVEMIEDDGIQPEPVNLVRVSQPFYSWEESLSRLQQFQAVQAQVILEQTNKQILVLFLS